MSYSENPAILNSSDLDDSFRSVSMSIPMTGCNDNEVSLLSSYTVSWKKKLCVSTRFLLLGGCLFGLIYLCVRLELIASFIGNYSMSVLAVGDFKSSFEIKEDVKLDLGLPGQLASMKPSSVLWNQTYLDLESS